MNKTKPTGASVGDYLADRANEQQADDAAVLIKLFRKLTKQEPYLWGPSIVGFGSYTYTYESGRSGEAPLAAFAIRGRDLVVYLDCEDDDKPLLAELGKHRMGKSCLYFRQLADLDLKTLEQLVKNSIATTRRRYG